MLLNFLLAMCIYPEAQGKAQEELDRVVGRERLPTFADRAALPYVEALYTEVLRWKQVAPLGESLRTAGPWKIGLTTTSQLFLTRQRKNATMRAT